VEIRGETDPGAPHFTALFQRGFRFVGAVLVNLNSVDRAAEFQSLQKHLSAGTIPEA
jgi:hypothetical protein